MSFYQQVKAIATRDTTQVHPIGVLKNGSHDVHDVYLDGVCIDRNGKEKTKSNAFLYTQICKGQHKSIHIQSAGYEEEGWSLQKNGKTLWKKHECIHHELFVHDDRIYTFLKEAKLYRGRLLDFDVIAKYDLKGKRIETVSLYNLRRELAKHHGLFSADIPFYPLPQRKSPSPWGGVYDYYRLNSLQILPSNVHEKTDSRFAKGNWLLTLRHASMLCILDKNKRVVWASVGNGLQGSHGAQLLADGSILVFDNGRYRGYSRVVLLDPQKKSVAWEFTHPQFYSPSQGYVQELSNGNYLVTSSEQGWVFELTKQKKIVWEYRTPHTNTDPRFPQTLGKPKWIYRARVIC